MVDNVSKPVIPFLNIMLCCTLMSAPATAVAQSALPQPLPFPALVTAPKDTPYPGTIRLEVDATDIDRHIFRVRESIPVSGGEPLTLLYPQWLPANHSARGRVDQLAGLMIHANGARLEWERDPVNVFAFHLRVPPEAKTIELEFQFVSATASDQGRVVMTPEMLNLQWTAVTLYPAGYFARQITVRPSVRVPNGWKVATALEAASSTGGLITFNEVSVEKLIDSPIFAGRHFKRVDLSPGGSVPVHLNIVADREDLLAITPEQLEIHRSLVREASELFGSYHFSHYDFLFALTDRLGGIGLEHHQSSENSAKPTHFTEWEKHARGRDLLAHEYVHSWNGKFRRPADLWTPDYDVPMRGSLLWVYEGQTQYWGNVLAARAGFHSKQQALDALAIVAATYDHRVGRQWRALKDTTTDPIASMRRPQAWRSWQRNEDYYSEGQLIWLDADTLIRKLSGGKKSLDDFAQAFFGINDGSFVPVTYIFDDVVHALNFVQAYDWAKFLRERLISHGPGAPLDGIQRGGYKLVFTDTPSEYFEGYETSRKLSNLTYSVGMIVKEDGVLSDVRWEGPAFNAGLTVGNQMIAVNGIVFDIEDLKQAITATKQTGAAIDILVKDGDHYRTISINYRGGLRYPHLLREGDAPAILDMILTPRSALTDLESRAPH